MSFSRYQLKIISSLSFALLHLLVVAQEFQPPYGANMHHPFGFEVLFTCQRAFITVTANAVPWNADLCLRIALRQIVTNILKVLTFFDKCLSYAFV